MDVSGRLSSQAPNFVLKDANQLYSRAVKAERPKGCSDIGARPPCLRPRRPRAPPLTASPLATPLPQGSRSPRSSMRCASRSWSRRGPSSAPRR